MITSCSCYLVEIYFFALAVGAGTFQDGVFADVSAAALAVISVRAGQKLLPAILTQAVIGFADVLPTVYAHSGPEKLV